MSVTRQHVEFAKRIFYDRLGDPYVYGGNWDPGNVTTGTDCSGLVGDVLDAANQGTGMPWQRSVSTESWPYDYAAGRPAAPGTVGPKGTIAIARLSDAPADAAVLVNIHHGGGGENSHTQCVLDGIVMESNGDHGTCTTGSGAIDPNSSYWTDHWYLPGPIVEDGTPRREPPAPMTEAPDTLFADVSEFQAVVTDAYTAATYQDQGQSFPFRWLTIRTNDGGHRDANFAANYAWCVNACQGGRLAGFFVYFYWRPGSADVDTHIAMVEAAGGPHPQMASMMDIESGGNPSGDQSAELTAEYHRLGAWLGNEDRVIAYANLGDEKSMWQFKPQHVPFILAGYGANPSDPNVFKIAHQYTDGSGYGGGLPEGAPPFGKCDMNSADGFTPTQLAAACGINATPTGGISMADAGSIMNGLDGVDGAGQPLSYRTVHLLRDAQIGDLSSQTDGDAEGPNISSSQFDQTTTLAKILTRRYKGHDVFDMLALIGDKLGVL